MTYSPCPACGVTVRVDEGQIAGHTVQHATAAGCYPRCDGSGAPVHPVPYVDVRREEWPDGSAMNLSFAIRVF